MPHTIIIPLLVSCLKETRFFPCIVREAVYVVFPCIVSFLDTTWYFKKSRASEYKILEKSILPLIYRGILFYFDLI